MSEVQEDPKTPVSPKVTASTMTGAATILVLYFLGQLSFVATMPDEVKLALLVLITGALTFLAGWLKSDPLRRRYVGEHERQE